MTATVNLKKVFDNDQELFDFLSDIQVVPRVQPEGFYVAEEEGKVTGAVCLKWNTLKHTSSLELIHRSVKYRHLKLYRRIVGEIVFDHDIEDDECHIEQFVVRQGQGNEEIAWDLLQEGETFAANHLYKHITMELASGEPFIERVLKVK